jgi:cupin fold WbuC family metalloprotein
MELKVFSQEYFQALIGQAQRSPRRRQHRNIHEHYQDPCQRLFNAIEPDSYIPPHRHLADPRDELLVAIRGLMALVTFNDQGEVLNVLRFGSEKYGNELAVGAEVACGTWHTVIALVSGSVLLEAKAGPFDPAQPKGLAPWAPAEGSVEAANYLTKLQHQVAFLTD